MRFSIDFLLTKSLLCCTFESQLQNLTIMKRLLLISTFIFISLSLNAQVRGKKPPKMLSTQTGCVFRYPPKTKSFADINVAYSLHPQYSIGITIGRVKRFGYYVSAMSWCRVVALSTDMECDSNGFIDGEMQYFSGKSSNARLSLICGIMFRLSEQLALKTGIGYGTRALAWETGDGRWIRNDSYGYEGFELNAGLQFFIDNINISFDCVSNSLKTLEFKIGFGINKNK